MIRYWHPQEHGTVEIPNRDKTDPRDIDKLTIRGHQFTCTPAQAEVMDELIGERKSRAKRLDDKHAAKPAPEPAAEPKKDKPKKDKGKKG